MGNIDKDIEGTPVAVTPSDVTVYNPKLDAVYVGSGGNISYRFEPGGAVFILTEVTSGSFLRIKMAQILLTGTTATGIVGFL